MTIWLLVLVLMASLAALGLRQGAIRVGFSFLGILVGALLAVPLGKLLRPVLGSVGIKNPLLTWALGPFIIFILISAIFKVAAYYAHHKVDVFYKYRAGDLRLALWERLNQRIGLCLGLANGALYAVLICFIAYAFSYWTVQMATPDNDPKVLQILNRVGRDLQSTGFVKVVRAIDGLGDPFYQAADITGLLYNNSLLEARLNRYPAFLGLGERQEFQDLGSDNQFAEMRQRREPLRNVMDYPKVQAIINNPELMKTIWATAKPELKDLRTYLETGRSEKFDNEKILGRWKFDTSGAILMMRKAKPNISSIEMQRVRKWMTTAFDKTSLVAMTDGTALIKSLPSLKPPAPVAPGAPPPPVPGPQNLQGQWKNLDGKYQLSLNGTELTAVVEGDKLSVSGMPMGLAFSRED